MDEDDKKIFEKYLVDGRLRKGDHDRLAAKGVEQAFGDGTYSNETGIAARYVVPAFQAQESDDKVGAGSKAKSIEIVFAETERALMGDLSVSARKIFDALPRVDSGKWRIRRDLEDAGTAEDNPTLYITYFGRDRIASGQRTEWKLKFESFRTGYFSPIRKKIGESVE
ncbi:MAG: hypothetical protein IH838_08225 [Proteobacteria bacterium]|nr:hypothetical protein [Pseudomonadota bacterium]